MKNAMFKTTLMIFAASLALAVVAPVTAHAQDSSSTKYATTKHKKINKKKPVASDSRAAKQSKALAGLSTTPSSTQAKSAKVESGGARLTDSRADSMAPSSTLKKSKKNVSNDMVFDGSVVHGQYQIADGTTSVVENEKSLTSLIAPRRDFKDRMKAERSHNE